MKTKDFKFVPSVCKEREVDGVKIAPTHIGFIRLTVPTFDQRFQYLEDAGFSVNDKGEMDRTMSQLRPMRKMVGVSASHYVEVAIEEIESKEKFTSFEDLSNAPEMSNVMIEAAMALISGVKVSKN